MINGLWYPAKSSAEQNAELLLEQQSFQLWLNGELICQGKTAELTISARMGNIPRRIQLGDGSLFSTTDNSAIDLWQSQNKSAQSSHRLYRLESSWSIAALALVLIVGLSFSFIRWGIPQLSYQIAALLPAKTAEIVSQESLVLLDRNWLKQSRVDTKKQDQLRQHFTNKLLPLASTEHNFKLHFRRFEGLYLDEYDLDESQDSIPNAFALPSGDIIITDGLIELADNLEQIDAILLHEMAHVELNHGLQQLVQSTFLALSIAFISGDLSTVSEILISAQALILQSQYSQRFESEADHYAFEKMPQIKLDPIYFAQIMQKMEDFYQILAEQKQPKESEFDQVLNDLLQLFSSHPETADRIKQAQAHSKLYQQR